MRFLAFERAYILDGETCAHCEGSGLHPRPSRFYAPTCWGCRGLGRHLTRSARELWRLICETLGAPVVALESRIEPKHLDLVFGKQVGLGMAVDVVGARPRSWRIVRRVEVLAFAQRRLTFTDGTQLTVAAEISLARLLTPSELARVDAVMAQHLGRGSVFARALLPESVVRVGSVS